MTACMVNELYGEGMYLLPRRPMGFSSDRCIPRLSDGIDWNSDSDSARSSEVFTGVTGVMAREISAPFTSAWAHLGDSSTLSHIVLVCSASGNGGEPGRPCRYRIE